jgi:hypothetical protein
MPTGSPESESKECGGPRARGVMALARGGVALAALSRFEPKKTERTPQRLKWRSQTGERQAVYD